MPTQVQLPDGTIGEFPDGMKESEIEAVLQKQYGAPKIAPNVALPTTMDLLMGARPLNDTLSVVGSHLKNLVAGPYHAFTDAPQNAMEQQEKGTKANSGTVANALGQIGLGAARMLVNPTVDALKAVATSKNATDVMNHLSDAIPVAGPLARSIENDAQAHGALPALLGGAIDIGAPDAVGGVLGKIRGAAPGIAEGALNIRPTVRGFGKTPGRAILDETSGVRPETVEAQAQAKLDQLTPQLEAAAAAKSVKPNAARAMLPAPPEEIALHSSPDVSATPSRPVVLNQPTRPMKLGLPNPSESVPMSSLADVFPDQLPSATSSVRPAMNGGEASGMGPSEYIGQIPGERGGRGQVQGVLRRPFQAPDMDEPLPNLINPIASLAPARNSIGGSIADAISQNAEGLHGQLTPMQDFLNRRFATGDAIPENVTPSDLLNLKRGFSKEYLRWNPDRSTDAVASGRKVYGALDSELDRTVPEAAHINQRISSLIPVTDAAEKLGRADPISQRLQGKLRAHTGALASAIGGAAAGHAAGGGLLGSIGGAALGFGLPELAGGPTASMVLARGMDSRIPQFAVPPLFAGGILSPPKEKR